MADADVTARLRNPQHGVGVMEVAAQIREICAAIRPSENARARMEVREKIQPHALLRCTREIAAFGVLRMLGNFRQARPRDRRIGRTGVFGQHATARMQTCKRA